MKEAFERNEETYRFYSKKEGFIEQCHDLSSLTDHGPP